MPGIGYDAVGNILNIRRMGMAPAPIVFEPKVIDDLQLIYDASSNRLNKAQDSAPVAGINSTASSLGAMMHRYP